MALAIFPPARSPCIQAVAVNATILTAAVAVHCGSFGGGLALASLVRALLLVSSADFAHDDLVLDVNVLLAVLQRAVRFVFSICVLPKEAAAPFSHLSRTQHALKLLHPCTSADDYRSTAVGSSIISSQ